MSDAFSLLQDELSGLADKGLYRCRRVVETAQDVVLQADGHRLLNFCSNDYLGLANHPEVVKAFKKGAERYGVGSGSAHLICGHGRVHQQLEKELADFTGRDRVLLFSTGYMANLGVITALLGTSDAVFEDRLNHASLLDGGLFCGARFKRYRHGDVSSLNAALKTTVANKKLIVTDGVFSMDGDIAPIRDLSQTAGNYAAWLMVDDAHGLGVIGEQGKGSVAYHRLGQDEVPVLVGTLGKGFGTFGAFVAGSEVLIETLLQKSRTYIYTTALPPAVTEATRASLKLIMAENWRREKLQSLINRFRQGAGQLGLHLLDSTTPIQPLLVGDSKQAVDISNALFQRGFLVSAIRPPTVAKGKARLRITFSAKHREEHVDKLLDGLYRCI